MEKQTTPKTKKTETIIRTIVREVKFGKKDPFILNRIASLVENIEHLNFTDEEFAEHFPLCAGKTYDELKRIRREVYKQLSETIKEPSNSMLATYRMYVALVTLFPDRRVTQSNKKIKVAKDLWEFDNTGSFKRVFKLLENMDGVILIETYNAKKDASAD